MKEGEENKCNCVFCKGTKEEQQKAFAQIDKVQNFLKQEIDTSAEPYKLAVFVCCVLFNSIRMGSIAVGLSDEEAIKKMDEMIQEVRSKTLLMDTSEAKKLQEGMMKGKLSHPTMQ